MQVYHPEPLGAWIVAFCVTVAVEVPLVAWLGRSAEPGARRRLALALLANALSHPLVWFGFPALGLAWLPTTSLSEAWAWLSEAALYRWTFTRASWGSAAGLSFVANLASFAVGLGLWALRALP